MSSDLINEYLAEERRRAEIERNNDSVSRGEFNAATQAFGSDPRFAEAAVDLEVAKRRAYAQAEPHLQTKQMRQDILQAHGAVERQKSRAAMDERVDRFGTAYRYEARAREASGGQYRTKEDIARMMATDPAGLLAELRAQQQGPPPDTSGAQEVVDAINQRPRVTEGTDPNGTFSNISSGSIREGEFANLLKNAQREVTQRADEKAQAKADALRERGEEAQHDIKVMRHLTRYARDHGADQTSGALDSKALEDPVFAAKVEKYRGAIDRRRVDSKNLAIELEPDAKRPVGFRSSIGDDGKLLEGQLPGNAIDVEAINRIVERRIATEQQNRAAEDAQAELERNPPETPRRLDGPRRLLETLAAKVTERLPMPPEQPPVPFAGDSQSVEEFIAGGGDRELGRRILAKRRARRQ